MISEALISLEEALTRFESARDGFLTEAEVAAVREKLAELGVNIPVSEPALETAN